MRGTELSGLGGEEDTQRKKASPSYATTDRDRSSTCLSLLRLWLLGFLSRNLLVV